MQPVTRPMTRTLCLRAALGCTIAGSLIAASAAVAYAVNVAYGSKGYYGPIQGHGYYNQDSVYSNLHAFTEAANQANSTVPTGYMGGSADFYTSNGALCAASAWFYNSIPVSAIFNSEGRNCGAGYYYSDGDTRAYNPGHSGAYSTFSTFRSPNLYS